MIVFYAEFFGHVFGVAFNCVIDRKKNRLLQHFRGRKTKYYSVKLGKTPDCCKILTAQFNM